MDRIADSIVRVKNAQVARLDKVEVISNNAVLEIFKILKNVGYISDFEVIKDGSKKTLDVTLKYDKNNDPVIVDFKRVSKGSCRVYSKVKTMPRIANGYATVIVSTSKGIMTGKEAKEKKVGGEVLAYIL